MAFPQAMVFSLVVVMALPGCTDEAWPEVSNENCESHKIWRMKDKERRQEFSSFCSIIPTIVWPIAPDKWFSMSSEEQTQLRADMARSKGYGDRRGGFFTQP